MVYAASSGVHITEADNTCSINEQEDMQDWMIYFRSLQVAGGRLLHFGLNRKASAAFAPHPPHILHRMILYIIILGGGICMGEGN